MTSVTFPDGLERKAPSRPGIVEKEIGLSTSTGTLYGTLTLPPTRVDQAALIVAGSGPTDRDGNSAALPGKNDCLKLLASGLARAGIASIRADKRGVGASATTPERELRLETFVDDGIAWLDRLKGLGGFSHTTIVGHSEGSLVGALVARRGRVDAFISLEGAGLTAQDTLRRQLATQLPRPLMDAAEDVMNDLAAGSEVDPLPEVLTSEPALAAMFRPSVQPYLISWFGYDPAAVLASLDIPILVVQGTTDLQVGLEDAERLAAANPRAQRLVIDGMNHVLKEVPDDREVNLAAYCRADLELAPSLLPAIVGFIYPHMQERKKGASRWST
jgi:pimeloyl-ACP methyl ester carboxylesterase